MKRGFTIIELMMVIGIIGVLLGIVTTSASGAIKNSRARQRDALCRVVQTGLATYYAQNEKWPITLPSSRSNYEGANNSNDPDKIILKGEETCECVRELARQTKLGNPVLDVSGLFVSRYHGKAGDKYTGLEFMKAIHGTKSSSQKMKLAQMHFGYPDVESGKFRHFMIIYSIPGDTMTVTSQDSGLCKSSSYYE